MRTTSQRVDTGNLLSCAPKDRGVMAAFVSAAGFLGRVLLLALPFGVTLALERDPIRSVDVELSRDFVPPERIGVPAGDVVWLDVVVSVDGSRGCQSSSARIPDGAKSVTSGLVDTDAGHGNRLEKRQTCVITHRTEILLSESRKAEQQ